MPTIDRILKQFISEDFNLIEYQGSRKTGSYVWTEKGKFRDVFVDLEMYIL